jgi:hypothetical protein
VWFCDAARDQQSSFLSQVHTSCAVVRFLAVSWISLLEPEAVPNNGMSRPRTRGGGYGGGGSHGGAPAPAALLAGTVGRRSAAAAAAAQRRQREPRGCLGVVAARSERDKLEPRIDCTF